MWEDPIVAEVHRTREKLAAEYNFDIKAFFADLRNRQSALGARLVRQKNRPNQASQPDWGRHSGSFGFHVAGPGAATVKTPPDNSFKPKPVCGST